MNTFMKQTDVGDTSLGEHNVIFSDIVPDCIDPLMVRMRQIVNDRLTRNDRKVTKSFIKELRNASRVMMSKLAVFIQVHLACSWRIGNEHIVGGGNETCSSSI